MNILKHNKKFISNANKLLELINYLIINTGQIRHKDKNKWCRATTKYLAHKLKFSTRQIENYLKYLKDQKLIIIETSQLQKDTKTHKLYKLRKITTFKFIDIGQYNKKLILEQIFLEEYKKVRKLEKQWDNLIEKIFNALLISSKEIIKQIQTIVSPKIYQINELIEQSKELMEQSKELTQGIDLLKDINQMLPNQINEINILYTNILSKENTEELIEEINQQLPEIKPKVALSLNKPRKVIYGPVTLEEIEIIKNWGNDPTKPQNSWYN